MVSPSLVQQYRSRWAFAAIMLLVLHFILKLFGVTENATIVFAALAAMKYAEWSGYLDARRECIAAHGTPLARR
jgi:hypothetical protein